MPRPVVPLLATNNSSVKNFAVPKRSVSERLGARAGLPAIENSGGYSAEEPPLPIPNREVKLRSADGTA